MPVPPAPKTDWDAVRSAYEGDDQTVLSILEQFKLTKGQLYGRAQVEGWQKRRAVPRPPNTPRGATNQGTVLSAHHKKAALATRLFQALEERIMTIENDLHDHDAGHGERDARALTAMAKALDLLGEMMEQSEAQSAAKGAAEKQEIDVDEFRQSLIDRLESMRASGDGT